MSTSLRPMTPDEYGAWLPAAREHYAADITRAGASEELAREKSERDFARLLADGVATAGQWLYVVEADGESVGILWVAERDDDFGKNLFIYDIQIDEAQRGRGLGRAAMLLAEEEARRRGIATISLNVFGGNDVAQNLYRSLGYSEAAIYMVKRI
ncbi:MAG TPA: GNAT family N-acetyltransferase [Gaiellaceae bacterium]|jgi:ribosomal protein S18 acetylase RimI-like enzyme